MRRRELPFLLLLTAVFLVGALGHILLQTPKEAQREMTLHFTVEAASGYLVAALPRAGEEVTLLSASGTLAEVKRSERLLTGRKEGRTLTRPSVLTFTLSFTLRIPANVKEGRLYIGDRMLLIGEEVPLCGENYAFSARLTAFAPLFERKIG